MAKLPIPFSPPMVKGLIREIEQPGTGKTQTRRVVSKLRRFGNVREFGRSDTAGYDWHFRDKEGRFHDLRHAELLKYLPYAIGDRLYVREAWRVSKKWDETKPSLLPVRAMTVMFEAGGSFGGNTPFPKDRERLPSEYVSDLTYPPHLPDWAGKARPAMFMPRWASRLTLTVTDVRVQRLQDISEADAKAEGLESELDGDADDFGRPRIYEYFRAADFLPWNADPVEAYADLWDQLNYSRGFSWDANPWVAAFSFKPELINVDAWSE